VDSERSTGEPSGYWYSDHRDHAVMDLLGALRRFRRADESMRRRVSVDLGVNQLDLRALQLVIAGDRASHPLSPSDLSAQLSISTAATTKLVDRLVASGHLARTPHPHDRRSVVLGPTAHAHADLRRRMGAVHRRMGDAARAVPAQSRPAVIEFLTSMAAAMEDAPPTSSRPRA
jgi:DNA-binding MarR family transcriptional regulator